MFLLQTGMFTVMLFIAAHMDVRCMNTENTVYTCNGILYSHKEGNQNICRKWMKLEAVLLSKTGQTQNDK